MPARLLLRHIPAVMACLLLLLPGIPLAGPAPQPVARDKCPVCGMFVAKFPNWVASAKFRDGTIYFFDGPKDLFSYYLDPTSYTPGKRQTDITVLAVKEYYSLKIIDPRTAFFVTGSDVYGPMGHELIPFPSEKDATFKVDHKGKQIIRFNAVSKQLLKSLN